MNIINYTKNGFDAIPAGAKKIIVKIDNNLFSTFEVVNKNLNLTQAKKSIPFNLEQELLDDIEDLNFFINKVGSVFNVVIISKNILQSIKDSAKKLGVEVVGAHLSFMFLPNLEGKISYIKQDDNIIFRKNSFQGGEASSDLFFKLFGEDEITEIDNNTLSNDYIKINLLKYEFIEIWTKFIKPYVAIVIIFAVALLLNIVITALQNKQNEEKLIILKSHNQKVFTSIFPDITTIVDIKVQAEQKMANFSTQSKSSNNDFLSIIIAKNIHNKKINSLIFDKILEIK